MIKINLALRKTSAFADEEGESVGLTSITGFRLSKDEAKDLLGDPGVRSFLVALVVFLGGTYVVSTLKENELKKIDQKLQVELKRKTQLSQEYKKKAAADRLKKQLDSDEQQIRTKIETIKELVDGRSRAYDVLVALSEAIPEEVWVSKITVSDSDIKMAGSSTDFNQISDFMRKLEGSVYFQNVRLNSTQSRKDRSGLEIASFNITTQRGKK